MNQIKMILYRSRFHIWRKISHGYSVTSFILMFLLPGIIFLPGPAGAEVDWEVAGAIQLEAVPLDVAKPQGTDLTYILTDQAQVLIFAGEGKLIGKVPVDASVTAIDVTSTGEQLYLINSERKTLQTVDINFIAAINITDSPFLGPPDAAVTVAVFSDFQ